MSWSCMFAADSVESAIFIARHYPANIPYDAREHIVDVICSHRVPKKQFIILVESHGHVDSGEWVEYDILRQSTHDLRVKVIPISYPEDYGELD